MLLFVIDSMGDLDLRSPKSNQRTDEKLLVGTHLPPSSGINRGKYRYSDGSYFESSPALSGARRARLQSWFLQLRQLGNLGEVFSLPQPTHSFFRWYRCLDQARFSSYSVICSSLHLIAP